MSKKLTLRMDEKLIERAKEVAEKQEKSVSGMVADFFRQIDDEEPSTPDTSPMVRSLKGILKDADVSEDDYYRHLEEKHR